MLLEALRRHTPKVVVPLTKADLLTEAQRAEVLAFLKQQLRRKLVAELPMFLYSVRPEPSAFKAELSGNVLAPLLAGREEAAERIARHKPLCTRASNARLPASRPGRRPPDRVGATSVACKAA